MIGLSHSLNRSFGFPWLAPLIAPLALAVLISPAVAENGDISDSPWNFSLKAGGQDGSSSLGFEFRYDTIHPGMNFHIFGRYDALEDNRGLGAIDDRKYGGGLAFSKTLPDKANYFLGGSFLGEGDESFSQVYLGGKWKLSDSALLAGSYGFGLGDEKELLRTSTLSYTGEAVDWLRVGGEWFLRGGEEIDFHYRLTDPGGENIHGIDGQLTQVVRGTILLGLRGDVDLTEKDGVGRNWSGFFFVAFQPGSGRTGRVRLGINRNDVVSYPRILRRVRATAPSAPPLVLTPPSATVVGYTGDTVLFTVSGGVPPYTWSNGGDGGALTVLNATQAVWDEDYDFCDITGTATVTVTDSEGNSVTVIIDIPTEVC